jgi:hypothetical protein
MFDYPHLPFKKSKNALLEKTTFYFPFFASYESDSTLVRENLPDWSSKLGQNLSSSVKNC